MSLSKFGIAIKTGLNFPLLMSGVVIDDENGNPQCIATAASDMIAYHQAKYEYETLLREMLDGFALHEIICDPDGKPVDYRFLAVNPALERMTGLSAEQVVGRTVRFDHHLALSLVLSIMKLYGVWQPM